MRRRPGRFLLSDFLALERHDLRLEIESHRRDRATPGAPGREINGPDPTDTDEALAALISAVASGDELTDPEFEHLIELRDATIAALPGMPLLVRARCGRLVGAATWTHSIEWKRRNASWFTDLQGQVIERWSGVEMALRDEGPDGLPQFRDESMPFLQLALLDITHSGRRLRVGTYQDDDGFGLWTRPAVRELPSESGVWRTMEDLELPLGRVTDAQVTVEDSIVVEARLKVGGREMLLLAGEVEQGWEGKVRFVRFDESVLAFPDANAAHQIDWVPPRPR